MRPPLRALSMLSCLVFAASCVRTPAMEYRQGVEEARRQSEPEELLRRARAFTAAGDYTRAEQYYDLAVRAGADEAAILPQLVDVCVRDQRYRDAIQRLENSLRRRPNQHAQRFLLAALALAIGEVERARVELERVIAALPEHAEAHYALAVVLRDDLGSLSGADRHFREYLRLRPGGRHADEARGSLLEVVP